MKILNTILYILLSLTITISAQNIEVCDSLLQQAIKASDEKDYFHSLELLSKAKEIAEQKNAYEQQFWIYTNIGINYAELTDYRTSLDHFSKAYQIATQRLDKRFELSVINNIAGVYILDKKFDKALEQSLLAYKSALDSGDSLFVGGCAMNIANISLSLNKLDKTAEYISIAEKMFVNTPNDSLELQIIKANYLCKMGKHEEAYQKALQILNEAIETEQSAIETAALLVLTQTMLDIKDYNSAIRYSQQALKQAITIEERKNIYDTLAEAYYRTHRYHQAFAYKDSALQVTDSIRNIQEEQHFENANTQIELLRRENELEEYRLLRKGQSPCEFLGIGNHHIGLGPYQPDNQKPAGKRDFSNQYRARKTTTAITAKTTRRATHQSSTRRGALQTRNRTTRQGTHVKGHDSCQSQRYCYQYSQ